MPLAFMQVDFLVVNNSITVVKISGNKIKKKILADITQFHAFHPFKCFFMIFI